MRPWVVVVPGPKRPPSSGPALHLFGPPQGTRADSVVLRLLCMSARSRRKRLHRKRRQSAITDEPAGVPGVPSKALSNKASGEVDLASGDVVQLVRTLPF